MQNCSTVLRTNRGISTLLDLSLAISFMFTGIKRVLLGANYFMMNCGISECIYCLTSVGVTIMTSSHKSALGLPTKLAPYRSDTVYPAMIATTLSQYEYVLICDKSNIRVSGSPHE
ncbi:hypothetical protein PHYBLDRAFT_68215 [Phycomyces blakesleeanus NRRL 1555(-)]|uniref:Uncharacterized protein n=1 Tax=Phycomyces blakesleeanus (strain ATCC 8743b / DSM 1359 / FGSC 10004 / NBRC 33097 / NRRL 1555) TaxID=763407 RepID=A0A162N2K1_PHYB8|nr:hypothetical protein PHYBLDRAFT_68215 [Phycomyces blakesleeanus NRRL 1555(-)]OAD67848.1 hypothetical protein PHYBLDRAFT_68215 [Phycomyces blakesleeanus NRRL 1555(-)]|eukprot:XP_018285888.1 hypothetical protein PHYBLDRAFT_68215 [Phycomyces blakesleeanus NRRL 1555(-)]